MIRFLLAITLLIFAGLAFARPAYAALYDFDGTISCETLEAYLSRAVVMSGMCNEGVGYVEENVRALTNVKAKFIGRAALAWACPADDERHFAAAREGAEKVHAADPDIILQACVFEAIYSCKSPEGIKAGRTAGIENIPVPAWVFEAFGLPVEERNFDYEAMLFPDGHLRNLWADGASVPDVTRQETQLWFYYRARRYIDAGYEAIHFGQADLVGSRDEGRRVWTKLLAMVREYAKEHARRHYVLCDAHFFAENAKVGDKYLWDFHAFPLRPVTGATPFEAYLAVGHGDAGYKTMPPGIHPAGWRCDVIPQLYEVDNFASGLDSKPAHHVWGADEIGWFANCTEEYRNYWLEYAVDWLKENAPRGYVSMPGIRGCTVPLGIEPRRGVTYRFNTKSDACPEGFNQEETVKKIFARPFEWLPMGSVKQEKAGKKELLGFRPGRATLAESFSAPWATDNSIYTDEGLALLYRAYGAFSPADVAAAAKKEIEEKGAPKKEPLLTEEGLSFTGEQNLTLTAVPGPRFSLFITLRLDNEAFLDDFLLVGNGEYLKNGFYLKYYKKDDELYGEVADGTGKRRVAVFDYPKDEGVHTIGLVCDGKKLTSWVDGRISSGIDCGPMAKGPSSLTIGKTLRGCLIKDIKLYNYAVSDREAKAMRR